MYEIDSRDSLLVLEGIPRPESGAPLPLLVSNEGTVIVTYYANSQSPGWESFPSIADDASSDDPLAVVRFRNCNSFMFGAPNDEALIHGGHPLASRGLKPYRVYRVENSSWIRKLELMNSGHPQHRQEWFAKLQHIIITFHDSTFECVCAGCDASKAGGSVHAMIPTMVELLFSRELLSSMSKASPSADDLG